MGVYQCAPAHGYSADRANSVPPSQRPGTWGLIISGFSADRYVLKDFPGSSHRILARWIGKLPKGTRILELGPSLSHIAILTGRHDLHWCGLEASLGYLGALRRNFSSGAIVDIESLPRLPSRVDVVLAADVLEHLYDTDRMIRLIRDALRPGGTLLLSVPNIANLHVRLNLLFGRFAYADRGILDRTHRVFFTRRSASALLASNGFQIEDRAVSTIPLPLVLPRMPKPVLTVASRALGIATAVRPTLLGYQLLFRARRV